MKKKNNANYCQEMALCSTCFCWCLEQQSRQNTPSG